MLDKMYKINDDKVISETLEGETIIINLDTGNYYSTNITAAIIWNQIQSDNSIQKILQYFINHYDENKDIIEKSITEIIDLLLKDNLILESESNISENATEKTDDISKEPFITPKIEKYEDMKEMLLADPVHDVDKNDGWPKLK
jgi:hypothetical protein